MASLLGTQVSMPFRKYLDKTVVTDVEVRWETT